MRVLVMFDLPTLTSGDLREYRRFRKFLITSGFMMLQESVYCKLVQNSSVASTVTDNVRKNKPPEGLVQVLSVTERQYAKMEIIIGESHKDILDSDERLVII
ncbi:MAG: CRISPR-associated endonuclease Cas2 [Bacillota bacterium]|uniref:CRISPR-associated endonuclease Cas2 n=1 Tax=[Clostridium] aminophilum TaxID=1526 RepID=UPI0028A4B653|nr:CRISPR-associated endonuclease Cas2 [Bacillota bacterium]